MWIPKEELRSDFMVAKGVNRTNVGIDAETKFQPSEQLTDQGMRRTPYYQAITSCIPWTGIPQHHQNL